MSYVRAMFSESCSQLQVFFLSSTHQIDVVCEMEVTENSVVHPDGVGTQTSNVSCMMFSRKALDIVGESRHPCVEPPIFPFVEIVEP